MSSHPLLRLATAALALLAFLVFSALGYLGLVRPRAREAAALRDANALAETRLHAARLVAADPERFAEARRELSDDLDRLRGLLPAALAPGAAVAETRRLAEAAGYAVLDVAPAERRDLDFYSTLDVSITLAGTHRAEIAPLVDYLEGGAGPLRTLHGLTVDHNLGATTLVVRHYWAETGPPAGML